MRIVVVSYFMSFALLGRGLVLGFYFISSGVCGW